MWLTKIYFTLQEPGLSSGMSYTITGMLKVGVTKYSIMFYYTNCPVAVSFYTNAMNIQHFLCIS